MAAIMINSVQEKRWESGGERSEMEGRGESSRWTVEGEDGR
jgi:hypothetical protein